MADKKGGRDGVGGGGCILINRFRSSPYSVFGDKKQLKKLEKESQRFRKLQQKEEKKQLKAAAKLAKLKKRTSSSDNE